MRKIAVLLRGQPRFVKDGGILFNQLKNRFPECEFKVFAHSWNSYSGKMVHNDKSLFPKELFTYIPDDKIRNDISCWNPEKIIINDYHQVMKLTKQIYQKLSENECSHNWFKEYHRIHSLPINENKYLLFPTTMEIEKSRYNKALLNENDDIEYIKHITKAEHLTLMNILSQYYSAGLVTDMLEKYVIKTNYNPDLVILMRYDTALWIHNIEDLIDRINVSDYPNNPNIMCENISIIQRQAIISDWIFMGTFDAFHKSFSNPQKRLYNCFVDYFLELIELYNCTGHLHHLIWTKILDKEVVITQEKFIGFVLRPDCYNQSDLDIKTLDKFFNLRIKMETYKYPIFIDNQKFIFDDDYITSVKHIWNQLNE